MCKTWKHAEHKICKLLGAYRNQNPHGVDGFNERLAIEVKHKTKMPLTITTESQTRVELVLEDDEAETHNYVMMRVSVMQRLLDDPRKRSETYANRKMSKFALDALQQAQKGRIEQQVPIAVFHRKDQIYKDSVVLMTYLDYQQLVST